MSLELPPAKGRGSQCWYALIELTDEDRKQLDQWLHDPRITGERIAGALKAHKITGPQVQNHRHKHLDDPCR